MSWFKWANPGAPVVKPKPVAKPAAKPAVVPSVTVQKAGNNGGASWQPKAQQVATWQQQSTQQAGSTWQSKLQLVQEEYEEDQAEAEENEADEALDQAEALDFLAELEGAHLDDDDEDEELGGEPVVASGDDFEMLKAAILSRLVSNKAPMTPGKLGHDLGAKKKPIAAALYSLAEDGQVQKTEDQYPKWKVNGFARPLGNVQVPARFLYGAAPTTGKRKAAGALKKPSTQAQDFETLKLLVRSHFASNPAGITAGKLGYEINATKKLINAALYSCEKDGTAWTIGDKQAGEKLRWTGQPAQCNAEVPAAFCYQEVKAAQAAQPLAKKMKTTHAASTGGGFSTGDAFQDLKLLLHAHVAAAGEKGISSGALGYTLSGDRKAITAALHKCEAEGLVQGTFIEGKSKTPTWVSLQPPPAHALSVQMPAKFSYKGGKDSDGGGVQLQVAQPQAAMDLSMLPEADKRKALLSKKGGGKGLAAPMASITASAAASAPQGVNPISFLMEWAAKNKHTVSFNDVGQSGSQFLCQVTLGGEEVTVAAARNKKQAKANAATDALKKLGLQ